MGIIICPECGEDDNLSGTRRMDGGLQITCAACDHVWDRDMRLRCGLCGSDDLSYAPKPLWEKGRGDQSTPAGRIDAYHCHACGGRDVTSFNPVPGAPTH